MKTTLKILFILLSFSMLGQNDSAMDYEELKELVEKKERNSIFNRNHFESGLIYHSDLGIFANHQSLNMTLAYQFKNGIELGLGVGIHNNQLDIPLFNTDESRIDITGAPIFLSTKFFLANIGEGFIKPYFKSMFGGYSYSSQSDIETNKGKGIFFENGLGVAIKVSSFEEVYLDFSQYNLKTNGSMNNIELQQKYSYDVWFHEVIIRVGYSRRLFSNN